MDVLLSCWSRHPSRLQDNMMPMSPDDYKALSQYVSPRDIDAVVSNVNVFTHIGPKELKDKT